MTIEIADIELDLVGPFLEGIKPDTVLTVTEWAEQKRILPDTSAHPGPYRAEMTPWVIEPQNRLSVTDPAQKVIVN